MRRRRKKGNIITSIALILALVTIALLPLPVAHAANFSVSKSNVSIENGKSSTITINAPTHTGRLDIVSSNSTIAIVNESSVWVENNSKTITISAKSAGTATITIKGELYDATTEEEGDFSKTINVTVTKTATSGTSNSGATSSGNGSTSNNKQEVASGTSSSTGQSSSSATKPSSGTTTTAKPSTSNSSETKPSSSSSTVTSTEPIESNTVISSEQENMAIEENANQTENIIQEQAVEEVLNEELEEIVEKESNNAEINNMETVKTTTSKGKIIIITIVGVIALIIMFIGIGVSKNILRK